MTLVPLVLRLLPLRVPCPRELWTVKETRGHQACPACWAPCQRMRQEVMAMLL